MGRSENTLQVEELRGFVMTAPIERIWLYNSCIYFWPLNNTLLYRQSSVNFLCWETKNHSSWTDDTIRESLESNVWSDNVEHQAPRKASTVKLLPLLHLHHAHEWYGDNHVWIFTYCILSRWITMIWLIMIGRDWSLACAWNRRTEYMESLNKSSWHNYPSRKIGATGEKIGIAQLTCSTTMMTMTTSHSNHSQKGYWKCRVDPCPNWCAAGRMKNHI